MVCSKAVEDELDSNFRFFRFRDFFFQVNEAMEKGHKCPEKYENQREKGSQNRNEKKLEKIFLDFRRVQSVGSCSQKPTQRTYAVVSGSGLTENSNRFYKN